jgi:esterase/lipase superfamily enzyme
VVFTWLSDGNPADYVAGQADRKWSVPQLATILREIRDRFGPERFVIVAHSLGSRGTLIALERLLLDGYSDSVASRLILVAPDFDADAFGQRLPFFAHMVGNTTIYASDNDTPLRVSEGLHGHPRLGPGRGRAGRRGGLRDRGRISSRALSVQRP